MTDLVSNFWIRRSIDEPMKAHDSPILIGNSTVIGTDCADTFDSMHGAPDHGKEVDGVRDKAS